MGYIFVVMVRFKNRYLLVELVPMMETASNKPAHPPHKKARLADLIADPPPTNDSEDKTDKADVLLNPSTVLQGISSVNVASYIRQSIETNFGLYATALQVQSFSVKYCNARTGTILVRSSRDRFQEVWASITFLTGLPPDMPNADKHVKCTWRVVHTSGTIRSAQKFAINRSASRIEKALQSCTDETRKSQLESIMKEAQAALKVIEP